MFCGIIIYVHVNMNVLFFLKHRGARLRHQATLSLILKHVPSQSWSISGSPASAKLLCLWWWHRSCRLHPRAHPRDQAELPEMHRASSLPGRSSSLLPVSPRILIKCFLNKAPAQHPLLRECFWATRPKMRHCRESHHYTMHMETHIPLNSSILFFHCYICWIYERKPNYTQQYGFRASRGK